MLNRIQELLKRYPIFSASAGSLSILSIGMGLHHSSIAPVLITFGIGAMLLCFFAALIDNQTMRKVERAVLGVLLTLIMAIISGVVILANTVPVAPSQSVCQSTE